MSLCLTVSFTYGGSKAGVTENSIGSVIAVLREDLATLRLDQPGGENIRVIAPGRVEFFWPNVMNGGLLHRGFEKKVNPKSPTSILKTDPERLYALSIIGVDYHVTRASDAQQQKIKVWSHAPSEYAPHHQSASASNTQETPETDNGGEVSADKESGLNSLLVRHRHSSSPPVNDGIEIQSGVQLNMLSPPRIYSRSDSIISSSGWKSPTPPVAANSIPLNDLKQAVTRDSLMDLTGSSGPNRSGAEVEGSLSPFKGTKRSRSQESQDSSSELPPFRPAVHTLDATDTKDFTSNAHSYCNETTHSSHQSTVSSPRKSRLEYFQLESTKSSDTTLDIKEVDPSAASRFHSKPRPIKPLPKGPRAFLQSEQSRNKSNGELQAWPGASSDNSPLAKLYNELAKLREELRAGAERQNAIIEELQRVGAEDAILKPMRAVVARNAEEGGSKEITNMNPSEVARSRLRAIEKEIEIEQRKKNVTIQELKAIEREGREPFVVPALLDAFIKLSELTTEANERVSLSIRHDES